MRIEIFSGSNPSSRHLYFAQIREGGITLHLGPALSSFRLAWQAAAKWVEEEIEKRERERPVTPNYGGTTWKF